MNIFPKPSVEWVNSRQLLDANDIAKAVKLGLLSADYQIDSENTFSNIESPLQPDDIDSVNAKVFPVLMYFLYCVWSILDHPRSTLEDIVLEFRNCDVVCYSKVDLFGFVAGITSGSEIISKEFVTDNVRAHQYLGTVILYYITEGLLSFPS